MTEQSQGHGSPLPVPGGDNTRLRPREETQGVTPSHSPRKSSPRLRFRSRETIQQRRHSMGGEFLPWAHHPWAEGHWLRAAGRTESAVGISHLASTPPRDSYAVNIILQRQRKRERTAPKVCFHVTQRTHSKG